MLGKEKEGRACDESMKKRGIGRGEKGRKEEGKIIRGSGRGGRCNVKRGRGERACDESMKKKGIGRGEKGRKETGKIKRGRGRGGRGNVIQEKRRKDW